MSLEALAIALHHSRAGSAIAKLVLIGIANHDGDGGSFPAVRTLAKYASCSDRAVQRAVDELERLGEVRKHINGGGTRWTSDHTRPNLYEFLLVCPPGCDRSKNHRMPRQSRQTELDGFMPPSTGVEKTGYRPGDTVSPGDRLSPDPVTYSHPNQSYEATTETSENGVQTAHARVRRGWDHPCIDGTQQHAISRTTGACGYCGARPTQWQEFE